MYKITIAELKEIIRNLNDTKLSSVTKRKKLATKIKRNYNL